MSAPHNPNDSGRRPVRVPRCRPAEQAQLAALWALSLEQRVARMCTRQLSTSQLWAWASPHPEQVPTLNGEFWFIAVHLADNES